MNQKAITADAGQVAAQSPAREESPRAGSGEFIPRPTGRPAAREDVLLPAAERYAQNHNLTEFMTETSEWILNYVRRRLNRDPDIVGDFYVHIYDRIPIYLGAYFDGASAAPCTAYVAVRLRHDFMNFIRARRRGQPVEQGWYEDMRDCARPQRSSNFRLESRAGLAIYARIDALPLNLRLPVKLVHGLDPDREELHALVRLTGDARRAALLMQSFHDRREAHRARMERLADRAARLTVLIDSSDRRTDLRGDPARWSRWKKRLTDTLRAHHPLFTLAELGTLFGRNKSTMMRRLDQALRHLRDDEGVQTWRQTWEAQTN